MRGYEIIIISAYVQTSIASSHVISRYDENKLLQ